MKKMRETRSWQEQKTRNMSRQRSFLKPIVKAANKSARKFNSWVEMNMCTSGYVTTLSHVWRRCMYACSILLLGLVSLASAFSLSTILSPRTYEVSLAQRPPTDVWAWQTRGERRPFAFSMFTFTGQTHRLRPLQAYPTTEEAGDVSTLADGLVINVWEHAEECLVSEHKYKLRLGKDTHPNIERPNLEPFPAPVNLVGSDPAAPPVELLKVTDGPIFTAAECNAIVDEAEMREEWVIGGPWHTGKRSLVCFSISLSLSPSSLSTSLPLPLSLSIPLLRTPPLSHTFPLPSLLALSTPSHPSQPTYPTTSPDDARPTEFPGIDLPIETLPNAMDFLQTALPCRLFPFLVAALPELCADPALLRVADLFLVKYDENLGQVRVCDCVCVYVYILYRYIYMFM